MARVERRRGEGAAQPAVLNRGHLRRALKLLETCRQDWERSSSSDI